MAQQFTNVTFDPKQCRVEIDEFGALLRAKAELSEKYDIQPFFKNRVQVSAFIGSFMRNIGAATQICFEYNFFGDFAADIVLGDKAYRQFCVVEFEDGRSQRSSNHHRPGTREFGALGSSTASRRSLTGSRCSTT